MTTPYHLCPPCHKHWIKPLPKMQPKKLAKPSYYSIIQIVKFKRGKPQGNCI